MWEVIIEKYDPFKHKVNRYKYTDFSNKEEVMEYVNEIMSEDHECGIWIDDLDDEECEYINGPKCLQSLVCKTYKGRE